MRRRPGLRGGCGSLQPTLEPAASLVPPVRRRPSGARRLGPRFRALIRRHRCRQRRDLTVIRSPRWAIVLLAIVLGGCGVDRVAGDGSAAGPQSAVERSGGATAPCDLFTPEQRGMLGVTGGVPADSTLGGAAICRWRTAAADGDSFRGGFYPERVALSDIERNYPDPTRVAIAGTQAISAPSDDDVRDRSCMIFAERPGGGILMMSYFWEGNPADSTHEFACSRATTAFEMALTTLRSR
ncbi:MAG: DUF3558 domain-containing protein [Pseudonocardiaceae bacterium]|nr:MAG: DUF3558 domain-containing protein [Pseudonocardiaceae bacterium]